MVSVGPVTLTGTHVALEPLSMRHVDELVAAATQGRQSYDYTYVPADAASMADYVGDLLTQAAHDGAVPFTQRRTAYGVAVGCTRFMELRRWRDRPEPDEVEIGGTWLAADAQRTPVNTEAKLLQCTHAFEVWSVVRVAWCTDARNERSRAAIERLGASFEGILRNHRPSTVEGELGRPRDTAMFAMTADEWPAAKARLESRLARVGAP